MSRVNKLTRLTFFLKPNPSTISFRPKVQTLELSLSRMDPITAKFLLWICSPLRPPVLK